MKSILIKMIGIYFLFVFSLGQAQISDQLEANLNKKVKSLELQNASINQALQMLAKNYDLNLIISSEIKGNVTVSLHRVSVRDALSAILNSNGYHFVIENDVLLVKAYQRSIFGELDSKVFKLKYIDAVELLEPVTTMLTDKGSAQVLDLVKAEEIDKRRSDVLLVNDIPDNLERISRVINELDVEEQQILIEVRLIETILGDQDKFGFDWPKRVQANLGGADPNESGTFDVTGYPNAGTMKFPLKDHSFNWGVLSVSELQFTLNMLSESEDSKLVSNPRVTTQNNKRAYIRVGTTYPIPEVNRGAGGDLITYKDKQVDVELEVVPRIEPGNTIKLTVHPSIEEIIGFTGPGDFPQPITSLREVETVISVAPDETVVLGGMVKETKKSVENKIFLLGDIPLLGALFTSTEEENKKTDLLIFITPKLVTGTSE